MNYYPHHIGDFDRATRHLSRVERSIYRDLIELYYDIELPLTLDLDALCRKIIARTDEERTAVEQTLNEFFTKTEQGWYHDRCELEIEAYRNSTSQKSAAGKASAAKRAEKRQQAINGKSTAVEQTLNERATNQEPRTKNQEPIKAKALSGKPDESRELALGILDYLNLKAGREFGPVDANVNLIAARLREGGTVTNCKAVIDYKVKQWKDDEKMREYIRPLTLFSKTNFANYVGNLNVPIGIAKSQQQDFATMEYGPSGELP